MSLDNPIVVADEVIRPNDTTQYSSMDVVGSTPSKLLTFHDVVPVPHMGFWILTPKLISDNTPTTPGSFLLMLFSEKVTVPNDNSPFAPTSEELSSIIMTIPLDTAYKISNATVYFPSFYTPTYALCGGNKREIYGVLLDYSAYTPKANEKFRVVLAGCWECK